MASLHQKIGYRPKLCNKTVCTLEFLINVLFGINVLEGIFLKINKRVGPYKRVGRTFRKVQKYMLEGKSDKISCLTKIFCKYGVEKCA